MPTACSLPVPFGAVRVTVHDGCQCWLPQGRLGYRRIGVKLIGQKGWVQVGPSNESPERGFKVTLLLADYAHVADGKLYVMGGGWTVTGPQPTPFAIAGIIEVPWHQTNRGHKFRFELIDLDGNAVPIETPEGEQPLFMEGDFEVGRPPGVRQGTGMPVPFALNSGAVQLPPGGHFEWRFTINEEHNEDWRLAFSTRPDAQSRAA